MIRIALSMLAALVAFASLPVQAQRTPFSDLNGLWLDPSAQDRVMVFSPSVGAREIELPIGRIVLRSASDKRAGRFTVAASGALCTYAVNPSDGTMNYKLPGLNWLFRPDVTVGRRMTWQRLEGPAPCPQFVELVRVDASLPEAYQAAPEECDRLAADPWDTTKPIGFAGIDIIGQVKGANPLPLLPGCRRHWTRRWPQDLSTSSRAEGRGACTSRPQRSRARLRGHSLVSRCRRGWSRRGQNRRSCRYALYDLSHEENQRRRRARRKAAS